MADRLAVLIFSVDDSTDDEVADAVVTQMEAPPDWTFESATVVTNRQEFQMRGYSGTEHR